MRESHLNDAKLFYSEIYYKDFPHKFYKDFVQQTLFYRHKKTILMKLANPSQGEKILDAGCGIGTIMVEFSRMGANTIGIDIARQSLFIAKNIFSKYGNGKAYFIQGEAKHLPFKNNIFDKIICADLVEHLDNNTFILFIKECKFILKNMGKMIIYTPSPTHLFELVKKYISPDISHIGLKDMKFLISNLTACGYKIEDSYFASSHIPVWKNIELLLMNIKFIGKFFRRRICISANNVV